MVGFWVWWSLEGVGVLKFGQFTLRQILYRMRLFSDFLDTNFSSKIAFLCQILVCHIETRKDALFALEPSVKKSDPYDAPYKSYSHFTKRPQIIKNPNLKNCSDNTHIFKYFVELQTPEKRV